MRLTQAKGSASRMNIAPIQWIVIVVCCGVWIHWALVIIENRYGDGHR